MILSQYENRINTAGVARSTGPPISLFWAKNSGKQRENSRLSRCYRGSGNGGNAGFLRQTRWRPL
jgi:hypothetical protein